MVVLPQLGLPASATTKGLPGASGGGEYSSGVATEVDIGVTKEKRRKT
jgi:hypothetical protein